MSTQDPVIKVVATVTIEMTEEQAAAYSDEYGAMAHEIAGRLRGDMTEALQEVRWIREFASVSITKPHFVEDQT